jgi:phage FluMu protein Com
VLKNPRFFLILCMNHIKCDHCGDIGAKVTLDKQFVCTECARLLYRTA